MTLSLTLVVAGRVDAPGPLAQAELRAALSRVGVSVEPVSGGRIRIGAEVVGTVTRWAPDGRVECRWTSRPWKAPKEVRLRLRTHGSGARTQIRVELTYPTGWPNGPTEETIGWAVGAVLAPLCKALSPASVGDWLTDRNARRPSGRRAEQSYSEPLFHLPNFLLILDRLAPGPKDRLLEVGCGGGALLRRVLARGGTAVGVDHSPDLLRVASESNREAISSGRLRLLAGEADDLPVPSGRFTCAVMTGVINFLPDPTAALREIYRALRPGGRLAVFGGGVALKGTPAAPEPIASRLHFFSAPELARFARAAGFATVKVEQPRMQRYAEAAHLPREAMPLFRGRGGAQLLLARKGGPRRRRVNPSKAQPTKAR